MTPEKQWAWIESRAKAMGATDAAMRKWRERGGVPIKWRLFLNEHARRTRTKIDQKIYDNPPARNGGNHG